MSDAPPALPPGLTLRQLQAFLALTQERHFTRAAARCHLSQPAFSAQIQALEDTLGLRLFHRSTRLVQLTAAGESFAPRAFRALQTLGLAVQDLQDQATLRQGRVRLALLPSLAAGWLPEVLAGFLGRHPGLQVSVADVLSQACLQQVADGTADLALAALPADAERAHPLLQADPFCADAFHLVAPWGHPLLEGEVPDGPQALSPWPFIHLARSTSVRQCLEDALPVGALTGGMEVEQLATVMGLVRAGLGLSIVPALALFHFQGRPGVGTRALDWPGLRPRPLWSVRRRDRPLTPAAQALLDWLRDHRPSAPTADRCAAQD